jgi:hypothetical protein
MGNGPICRKYTKILHPLNETMRKNSYLILLGGVVLVAISWVWPRLVGGTQSWSDEQAESYAQAAAALHTLTYKTAQAQEMAQRTAAGKNPQVVLADKQLSKAAAAGTPVDPTTATADRMATELAVAKERYQRERGQFEAARSHGQSMATIMRWLGAALIAFGLIARLRQSNGAS